MNESGGDQEIPITQSDQEAAEPEQPYKTSRRGFLRSVKNTAAALLATNVLAPVRLTQADVKMIETNREPKGIDPSEVNDLLPTQRRQEKLARATVENTVDTPIPEFEVLAGTHNVLGIRVRNYDTPLPPDDIVLLAFYHRAKEFFKTTSYGLFNLEFNEVSNEWFVLNEFDVYDSNALNMSKFIDQKLEKLEKEGKLHSGKRLSDFQTRLYILAQKTGLKPPVGGYGQSSDFSGMPYNQAWVYEQECSWAFLHEIGHTIDLMHVGKRKGVDGNYSIGSYVENTGSSLMGNRPDYDLAGPQKLQLGWIKPGEVNIVKDNSEVKLQLVQNADSKTKMVRIFKPDTKQYYFIEWNKESFNNPRLKFYVWDQVKNSQLECIDNPFGNDPSSKEFHDKVNGIRVNLIGSTGSYDETEVTLKISFEK